VKSSRALKTALGRIGAVALAGRAVRLVDEEWSSCDDVVSGVGAYLSGGRYNAPKSFCAVYLTENAQVGLAEVAYPLSAGGSFDLNGAARLTVVPVSFKLLRVLDLCDYRVRIALGTDRDEILQDFGLYEARGVLAPTQTLGKVAYRMGWSAIKYPSKHEPAVCNLVVFPGNLRKGEYLRPQKPKR